MELKLYEIVCISSVENSISAFGLQCSSDFVHTVYNSFSLVTGLFRVVSCFVHADLSYFSIVEFAVVWCFSFRCWELFFCKKSALSIDIYHMQQSRLCAKILLRIPAVLLPLCISMPFACFLSFSSLQYQREGGMFLSPFVTHDQSTVTVSSSLSADRL